MNPRQIMSATYDEPITSQYEFWYRPAMSRTMFSAKRGLVKVAAGLLTVSDLETKQELYTIPLASDIKIYRSGGSARISFMNGQKINWFDHKTSFLFHNPWLDLFYRISPTFLIGRTTAKRFVDDCMRAAGAIQ